MNIAIVTGASSGLGREFVKQLAFRTASIDEIWVIARREERLRELAAQLAVPIKVLPWDLTKDDSLQQLRAMLQEERPKVRMLVNAAGFGKFGSYRDLSEQETRDMMALNMQALVLTTRLVLPFMPGGGRIVNMASMAAFQPLPYFGLYAATKSFVLSYSRALHEELRERCISVTAVCPGFVDTEFIQVARDTKRPNACTHYKPLYQAPDIVRRALLDAQRRKDISVYGINTNLKRFMAKMAPQPLINYVWRYLRRH